MVVERGGKAEQEVCIAKTWQTWRCRWPSWQERGTGGEAEEGGGDGDVNDNEKTKHPTSYAEEDKF